MLFVDGGADAVGIGTGSPDNKLHVYKGDSGHSWSFDGGDCFILENSDSVSLNIATPNSNTGNILFSDAAARGQGRIVYDHSSDHMGFMTAGVSSERMRIDSSGNVGIGTSTIDNNAKLHIEDSAYPIINLDRSSISSDGNHIGYINFQNNGDIYGRIGVWVEDISETDGELRFATQKGTSLTDKMVLTSDGAFTVTSLAGGHAVFNEGGIDADFRVESSGNANMLHVDGGDDVVNIGTSTDFGETFNVSGTGHFSSNVTLSRQSNDTGSTGLILEKTRNTSVNGNTVVQNGDQLGYVAFRGNDGDQFIDGAYVISFVDGTPGNNDMPTNLQFWTTADGANSPTERMRIDSSGNVGIGTNDPSGAFLHVTGTSTGLSGDFTNTNTSGYGLRVTTYGTGAQYGLAVDSYGGGYTRDFTVGADGDVNVLTGNLVIGTAGKGIWFETNPNAAGMTSELLDDYEEGTWTPVLSDGTNNATTNANGWTHGTYVKVGIMVWLQCTMNTSSLGSVSGAIRITGLPFASVATYINPIFVFGSQMNLTAQDSVTGRIIYGESCMHLATWDGAGGASSMQATEWSDDGYANISAMYRAA